MQVQKYKQTEIGEIPEEWSVSLLEEITDSSRHSIKRGPWGGSITKAMFVNSGYKIYEQKNVIYNDFKLGNYYIKKEKFDELKDFMIKPNDILISCSGTFGKIAIVPREIEPGIINQALLKLSFNKDKVDIEYFKYFFESDEIQKKLFGLTHGSAIKNIVSISILKKMKFPIPPLKEQQKIASVLSNVDNLIQKLKDKKKSEEILKQGLMQQLLTGKIRVKV